MDERGIIALLNPERLRRILSKMLDENEFLSPYGIRSLSKFHEQNPYILHVGGQEYRVDYLPGESNTGMFGGNSNWRGPVWMPVNAMIIRALLNFYLYYGDNFKIECPTGSGKMMNLFEVSKEIADRLSRIFLRNEQGQRPVYGGTEKFQSDPHWRDHILFYEYFHGDNGAGLGASHQTGWTGLVAKTIQLYGLLDAKLVLEGGKRGCVQGTPPESQRMNDWRNYPVIYEINTWVWLGELSRTHRRPVTLATVPDQEWDALAAHGFDAVWFMGVWERSPAGIAISMKNEGLLADFRRALPDFSPEDNVGSPYCVRRYVVDQHLGGPAGLATSQKEAGRPGPATDPGFRPESRGAGSSLGRRSIRTISSRATATIGHRSRASFSRPAARFWPWGEIRTLRPGPMWCNSTGFIQDCARRSSRPWDLLPGNATACAAIWRCCS